MNVRLERKLRAFQKRTAHFQVILLLLTVKRVVHKFGLIRTFFVKRANILGERHNMERATGWRDRVREGRAGLLGAATAVIVGALLIYVANNTLNANTPGQALVAYIGVFVIAAGVVYGASTLLDLRR